MRNEHWHLHAPDPHPKSLESNKRARRVGRERNVSPSDEEHITVSIREWEEWERDCSSEHFPPGTALGETWSHLCRLRTDREPLSPRPGSARALAARGLLQCRSGASQVLPLLLV